MTFFVFTYSLEFKKERGVITLSNDTFQQAQVENHPLFVHFYTHDCGFCNLLNPIFEQCALSLEKLHNITNVFAKLNANDELEISEEYAIFGTPKLSYFQGGRVYPYDGSRTHQDLLQFVLKNHGITLTEINSQEDYDDFITYNDVVGIFYDRTHIGITYIIYQTLPLMFPHVMFAYTNKLEIMEKIFMHENTEFRIFKIPENRTVDYTGPFEHTHLHKFIDTNSYHDVIPFDDKAVERIFHQGNAAIFLLVDNSPKSQQAVKVFMNTAVLLTRRIIFSISNKTEDSIIYSKLEEYLTPKHGLLPAIFICQPLGHQKFLFENQITQDNIERFIEAFEQGQLPRYFKSEDIPEVNNAAVKIIVAQNFKQLVLDTEEDVLVLFYSHECHHCQRFLPIYERVANQLKDTPNLIFGQFDIRKNELQNLSLSGSPTLYLYQAGQKDKPQLYNTDKSEESLVKFLEHYFKREKIIRKKDEL